MPVQRLRGRDAQVNESISSNEPVANVYRLRLIVEKAEKAGQDQRLAYGKGKEK